MHSIKKHQIALQRKVKLRIRILFVKKIARKLNEITYKQEKDANSNSQRTLSYFSFEQLKMRYDLCCDA
jgi:hypothetical protein